MPVFSDDTTAKELYLYALNQLLSYDNPNANPKILFQAFSTLLKADWDKVGAPDFCEYEQATFLDQLPAWGTFAVPTQTSLYEAYGDFLQTLMNVIADSAATYPVITPTDLAKIQSLQSIQKTAMGNNDSGYNYYNSLATQDWKNELVNNPTTPDTPYNKLYFLQSDSNYIIAQGYLNEANNASYQILDILSKADPDFKLLSAANINYLSQNNQIRVPQNISDEGKTNNYISVPKQLFEQDIFEFENAVNATGSTINNQTGQSDYTETHWGGSFGVSFGFFSVGGSAYSDQINSLIHTQDISIALNFQNLGPFIISRAAWYDQYIIEKLGSLVPQYFGQNGPLALVPQQIICARGVEVVITSTAATSSLFESHFQGGGSFGIGPFNFGGSYDSTHIHTEYSNSGSSFSMKSTEKEVYILGQLCYTANTDSQEMYHVKTRALDYKRSFDLKTKSLV